MNQPIKIAVADDHKMMREGLISMISSFQEFEVIISAGNGIELINAISAAKSLPDVCLLDISMPKKNGYETMKEIRNNWPQLKVLAISTFDTEYAVVQMLKLGAKGYLSKNFDNPSDLKKALLSIHTKGFHFSELVDKRAIRALNTDNKNAPKISDQEMVFLKFSCSEYHYEDIAKLMNVSKRTVEGYRDSLFKKFLINSRNGLSIFALKNGIVSLEEAEVESSR